MNSKLLDFYKNKKVLITGHTGFKGTWMSMVLIKAGAEVTGYSLEPPTTPSLFQLCDLESKMNSIIGDVRDFDLLKKTFDDCKPEIVIHMAAQPLVRESYKNPVYTFDVNVMGTVNVLECVRQTPSVKSFINVTTDKVYKNNEWERGYVEGDELNGYDPYSNSKSCSELVTSSYKNSFFGGETGTCADGRKIAVSTMRAGNVIGGGDFATDRIIPDCIRAVEKGEMIVVRNPYSTRPYQHVLEPVTAYLSVAATQYEDISKAGNYNVGPEDEDCINTGSLVDLFVETWNRDLNGLNEALRVDIPDGGPHEAGFLKLNSAKIKDTFGWKNSWHIGDDMEMIVEWSKAYLRGEDIVAVMDKQIDKYIEKVETLG